MKRAVQLTLKNKLKIKIKDKRQGNMGKWI